MLREPADKWKDDAMIEELSGFPEDVAAFACHGKVTREEYESVLIPALEARFKEHSRLRLYYEVADDFDVIQFGAMWDDFLEGMKHLLQWDRIAVVTDVQWIHMTIRGFGFFVPAPLRVFPLAEKDEARSWITAA